MSFAVQKTMIMRNKEQSKLAMIQKMDLLNNQIDTAESRPNFNRDDPPARWITSLIIQVVLDQSEILIRYMFL